MVVKITTDWDQSLAFNLPDNWEPIGVTHLNNKVVGLVVKREIPEIPEPTQTSKRGIRRKKRQ